jgi:hypothetical protein
MKVGNLSRCAIVITLASAVPLMLTAQTVTRPSIPRAPDGHPDFQGMWTNQTLTPLERPAALADKATLTEAEAAKYANEFLESSSTDRRDGGAQADVSRAYPDYFLDRGTELARVNNQRRTSLITDPSNGRIPYLADRGGRRADGRPSGDQSNNYDDPEARPLAERCLLSFGSSSGPPMLPVLYNNHYRIVQTRTDLMIEVEMVHDARIIHLDGRPHLPKDIRRWLGDSVGHWEGDTLVVDTTNFAEQVSFRGASPDLHVVERFTFADAKTILYRFTVEDASTFARPWSGEIPIRATDDQMYEYACHEGNHALESILRGARFQDKAAGKSR